MRITLTVWPRRLPYSSASAVQALPLRRYCVAISPESLSCWSAQAPRTYEARLRSRPLRSASRAAALKSTRFGGTSKADIASSKVDLPDPERPTNKKPRSAIGTSTRPLNVPQLKTCRRRMRNCSSRGSGRSDRNNDGATARAGLGFFGALFRGALGLVLIRSPRRRHRATRDRPAPTPARLRRKTTASMQARLRNDLHCHAVFPVRDFPSSWRSTKTRAWRNRPGRWIDSFRRPRAHRTRRPLQPPRDAHGLPPRQAAGEDAAAAPNR